MPPPATTASAFTSLPPAPVVSGGYSDITALCTARYGVPAVAKNVSVPANQNIDAWQDICHKLSAVVPAAS